MCTTKIAGSGVQFFSVYEFSFKNFPLISFMIVPTTIPRIIEGTKDEEEGGAFSLVSRVAAVGSVGTSVPGSFEGKKEERLGGGTLDSTCSPIVGGQNHLFYVKTIAFRNIQH